MELANRESNRPYWLKLRHALVHAGRHHLQMAAAAQHGNEALLLQSSVTSANVVFINIDWKATRHNSKRLKANMSKLGETIGGVVRNMKPAMICMCEVGSVSSPLTVECMQEVAEGTEQAWRDAATEHVELRTMLRCMPNPVLMPSHPPRSVFRTRTTTHSASLAVLWARRRHC